MGRTKLRLASTGNFLASSCSRSKAGDAAHLGPLSTSLSAPSRSKRAAGSAGRALAGGGGSFGSRRARLRTISILSDPLSRRLRCNVYCLRGPHLPTRTWASATPTRRTSRGARRRCGLLRSVAPRAGLPAFRGRGGERSSGLLPIGGADRLRAEPRAIPSNVRGGGVRFVQAPNREDAHPPRANRQPGAHRERHDPEDHPMTQHWSGSGTKADPWILKTPPLTSDYNLNAMTPPILSRSSVRLARAPLTTTLGRSTTCTRCCSPPETGCSSGARTTRKSQPLPLSKREAVLHQTQSAASTGSRRGFEGASACICLRCSKRLGSWSSNTTPRTTACGHSEALTKAGPKTDRFVVQDAREPPPAALTCVQQTA